jgi:hypothetical protein
MSLGEQSQPVHVWLSNPPIQDPWRTQGQYLDDQRRAQHLYRVAVASVVIALFSGGAAAVSAVAALRASAPAMSPWVLWSQGTTYTRQEIGRRPWEILRAEETKTACDKERLAAVKLNAEGGSGDEWRREIVRGGESVIHRRKDNADVQIVDTWLCLSAGTDPRPRVSN